MTRIVGIVLVRDDDVFVEQAVRNVSSFCDELILVDHQSRDETPSILARLADDLPHATAHSVRHPADSHALIKDRAGEPVWVFGVDGDELYDPRGLPQMRARLLAGEFDEWWSIKGNVLHCDAVEPGRRRASGWLAPPARSITKLFNFAALESWEGSVPERLHGGNPIFKGSHTWETVRFLRDDYGWEESPFRCLHTCFLPRSSRQPEALVARPSISDRNSASRRQRAAARLRALTGRPPQSAWKLDRYRQGPHVTVDAEGFFPG
ncbi:MAG: hypothetical protein QOF50_1962 [Gaiellaceae bacterium]|jgi:hypothetical protein|nr:hypothetical protein [Gaiellaceae bacterium]